MEKFEPMVKPGGVLIYDTNGITRHPVRTDISVYAIDATAECARMGQAKLFNTMILGGYLKVRPVVAMENVMVGLKKSLPERAWKMLPENEAAIRHGGEIIRKGAVKFPPRGPKRFRPNPPPKSSARILIRTLIRKSPVQPTGLFVCGESVGSYFCVFFFRRAGNRSDRT